jgi:ribonucleoside-diphosphate reductase alpha chain
MVKIEKPIVKVEVVKVDDQPETEVEKVVIQSPPVKLSRPFELKGSTYKLRTQVYKHAFYVTVNDMGGKPFEMFINSKNNNISVWTGAFTMMASAIFRGVPDISFLIKDMLEAIDPMGGHHAHQKHHESIVAEIFYIIDCRIKGIPINKKEQRPLNKAQEEAITDQIITNPIDNYKAPEIPEGCYIDKSCPECGNNIWRDVDGCPRCEGEDGCGFSKCG